MISVSSLSDPVSLSLVHLTVFLLRVVLVFSVLRINCSSVGMVSFMILYDSLLSGSLLIVCLERY